jgi:hypothetical protein
MIFIEQNKRVRDTGQMIQNQLINALEIGTTSYCKMERVAVFDALLDGL